MKLPVRRCQIYHEAVEVCRLVVDTPTNFYKYPTTMGFDKARRVMAKIYEAGFIETDNWTRSPRLLRDH